jgi:ATP-dependent helicase/nuclease subunit B
VGVSTDHPEHDGERSGPEAGVASSFEATPRRHFLGWDRPLVERAAAWFLEHAEVRDGAIVAADHLWVFSGSRAGREFQRRIREAAAERSLAIEPPAVATPGTFDRRAVDGVEIDLPPASELERHVAWASAVLELAAEDRLQPLIDAERATPQAAWALADRLIATIDEVRGEGLVPSECIDRDVASGDAERWRRVAEVEILARRRLEEADLLDPTVWRESAIEVAAAARARGVGPRVFAAGVLEWSGWQRRLLEATDADVLVAAPVERADDFDRFGAVVSDAWIGRPIDLEDDAVIVASTVPESIELVLDEVDRRAGAISIDEVTIGVADDELFPPLLRGARAAGLSVHAAPVAPLSASAPGRAIEGLRDLVERDAADRVAALLRHPDVARWLAPNAAETLPEACTRLFAERLPRALGDLLDACDKEPRWVRSGNRSRATEARSVLRAALLRLRDLVEEWSGEPRSSAAWARRLASWLGELYREDPSSAEEDLERLRGDLASVADELKGLSALPMSIDRPIAGAALLDRVLERLRRVRRPGPPSRGDEVEAAGWLELAADPAPHLVVAGLHDGAVPGEAGTDPLLAESLRERLGLACQRRRLARDAAILTMLAARCESLRIVVPLRGLDGTPRLPSRLLLGGEGEALARRVLALTEGSTATPASRRDEGVSRFGPPTPDPATPLPERLPITALRRYLADPYRFHLAHVEDLEESVEGGGELDARGFGTFAHAVVETAARRPEWADAKQADDLGRLLAEALEETATSWFGGRPSAGVRMQMRSLERRLRRLADCEAASRAQGWRTEQVEASLDGMLDLGHGVPPQRITGRIDRIDRQLGTGRLRILDYKTGDRAPDPATSHRVGRPPNHRWIDLQLPLYRHLHAAQHGLDEREIEVGYATLSAGPRGVAFRVIEKWSEAEFAEAIETAREVVRSIRERKFARDGGDA